MSDVCNDYQFTSTDSDSDVDRDLLFHYAFKSLLKKNYQCPFDGTVKKCLDIGYSSGFWMMEMATEFPHCQFYGIDIEPKAPDLVYPRNCSFEKGNFLDGLPYDDESFEIVHIRMTLFMINPEQFLLLLDEIKRIIKPGGYLEFLELDLSTNDSAGPLLSKLMTDVKVANVAADNHLSSMDRILVERGFVNTIKDISVPLGKWAGMAGELSLAILKLLIIHDIELDGGDVDQFIRSIVIECEQYKPLINVFSGFGRKL